MSVLLVYCHPNPNSYTAAVRDVVLGEVERAGAEATVIDLYGEGFNPVLTAQELEIYEDYPANIAPVSEHVAAIRAAKTMIFVYPTWWYGLPAMLKGWLDRVLLPEVAFIMPKAEGDDIKPALTQITRLGIFTTCGASWWLTRFVGFPGRRTISRGLRILMAKRARTVYAAHYLMDSSTPESRAQHLEHVRDRAQRLMRPLRSDISADRILTLRRRAT